MQNNPTWEDDITSEERADQIKKGMRVAPAWYGKWKHADAKPNGLRYPGEYRGPTAADLQRNRWREFLDLTHWQRSKVFPKSFDFLNPIVVPWMYDRHLGHAVDRDLNSHR